MGPNPPLAPVYWANDLFLRGAIALASDVAESGRASPPRTDRHGYSRPPLSAARRTFDSPGQTRLAIFRHSIAPAPAGASVHVAHPSNRPRSHSDDATARHSRRSQGIRTSSRRLDCRAPRAVAKGCALSVRHGGAVSWRSAPDRASRWPARDGVGGDPRQRRQDFSAWRAVSNTLTGGCMTF